MRRRRSIIGFLAALFLLFPLHVLAGSFKVVPVRLTLDARTKTAVLRLTNNGAEKVTVQLNAMVWSQNEVGEDKYAETKDIIFFPKIVGIEKGKERIIRVGYQGKPGAREKTYRLYIQELPVTKPGEGTALKFTLRMGVPVFIRPLKEVKERTIEEAWLLEGRLLTKVKNSGNTHFVVTGIKAIGLDNSGAEVFSRDMGGWYVLSGASRTFSMTIPREGCLKARAIEVEVDLEDSDMEARLDVDTAQCAKESEEPDEQERKR